eukprot:IDg20160t1
MNEIKLWESIPLTAVNKKGKNHYVDISKIELFSEHEGSRGYHKYSLIDSIGYAESSVGVLSRTPPGIKIKSCDFEIDN